MQNQTAIAKKNKDDDVEFVPFGSEDKIRLNLAVIRNYIAQPSNKNDLPDDRQCMRFLMLCKSRKLNPFEGDAFMLPFYNSQAQRYEWSLITAHSAFLKRAEVHPDYNGKSSGIIFAPPMRCRGCDGEGMIRDSATNNLRTCSVCNGRGEFDELPGDYVPETLYGEQIELVGGWCKVFYKSKSVPEYQRLRLSTYAKDNAQWKRDDAGMICKCAEAAALRGAFPTTMGGLYVQDEMPDEPDAPKIKKPVFRSNQPAVMDTEVVSDELPLEGEPPPKTPETQLVQLRALMKAAKVDEGGALAFLVKLGMVTPETLTFEQVILESPDTVSWVIDNWKEFHNKLKSSK